MIKFIIALLAVFTLATSPALAVDLLKPACDQASNSSVCQDHNAQQAAGTNPVNHIIHVAADIVATLTGAVAIIMIIVSAFKIITGGGSSESITSARNTLLWAVVGLAVVALAWTLLNFAIDTLIKN